MVRNGICAVTSGAEGGDGLLLPPLYGGIDGRTAPRGGGVMQEYPLERNARQALARVCQEGPDVPLLDEQDGHLAHADYLGGHGAQEQITH